MDDFNGNTYEHTEAIYKPCKRIRASGASAMPSGEPLGDYFERLFGLSSKEFVEMRGERHSREMATQQRPSKPRGMK